MWKRIIEMKKLRHIILAFALAAGAAGADALASVTDNGVQQELTSSTVSVKVGQGQVELTVNGDEPVKFHIYSITGQLVKSASSANGSIIVELPRGLYIVKCDKWSKQIVVK